MLRDTSVAEATDAERVPRTIRRAFGCTAARYLFPGKHQEVLPNLLFGGHQAPTDPVLPPHKRAANPAPVREALAVNLEEVQAYPAVAG